MQPTVSRCRDQWGKVGPSPAQPSPAQPSPAQSGAVLGDFIALSSNEETEEAAKIGPHFHYNAQRAGVGPFGVTRDVL